MAALVCPEVRPNAVPRPPLRVVSGGDRPAAALAHRYRRRRVAAALTAFASVWLVVGIVVPGAVRHLSSLTADQSTVTAGAGATGSAAGVQAVGPSPEVSPGPTPVAGAVSAGRTHVVRPGDTLWAIARKIKPEGDLRPVVDELARRTGGRPLQPGQRIELDGLDQQ